MSKSVRITSSSKDVDVTNNLTRMLKDIEINVIPNKYINKIIVTYGKYDKVILQGDDILNPIPLNPNGTWDCFERMSDNISDLNIVIDAEKLEKDCDRQANDLLNNIL